MNQNSAPTSATIRTGSNRDVVGGAGRDWVVLIGLICASIAIRLHGLSAANLWLDEANSWQVASGSWSHMLGELRGSPVGPLYFILLKIWISALGESAFALRAFSVSASVVLIVAVYEAGKSLLSRQAALLAAALMALSPLELYFAQEARMYMLTSLVAFLCLWAYARWQSEAIRSLDAPRWNMTALVTYVAAALALLLTHPVAGTLLVALNLDALVVWWRTRATRSALPGRGRVIISWIAAHVVIAALLLGYLAFLRLGTAASSQAWRSPLGLEVAIRNALLLPFNAISGQRFYASDFWTALSEVTHGRGGFGRFFLLLIVQPLTLFVFVLALDAGVRARINTPAEARSHVSLFSGRRLLALAVVVPLLFDVVISTTRGLETARYFLFVVPFLLLLLADGLTALPHRLRIASLMVLVAAMFFGTRATKQAVSRDSDYRSTAALLDQERKPGDRIMLQPREMNAPLRFYLHSRTDSIIGLAANASAGRELSKLEPGRTWVVIDY
ncbi:MAG TPA: glycosyltransferase family 39 protein, partial [Gemmatimonadaceae bacterium]|nr:glycosyltransferase family 39 protein [Gemmatimonadaceae bacterium]